MKIIGYNFEKDKNVADIIGVIEYWDGYGINGYSSGDVLLVNEQLYFWNRMVLK